MKTSPVPVTGAPGSGCCRWRGKGDSHPDPDSSVSGGAGRRIASGGILPVDQRLPRPLDGVDEVFDLVGGESVTPRPAVFEVHDLEECVFEDLEAALRGRMTSNRWKMRSGIQAKSPWMDANERISSAARMSPGSHRPRGPPAIPGVSGILCRKRMNDSDIRGWSSGSGWNILCGR